MMIRKPFVHVINCSKTFKKLSADSELRANTRPSPMFAIDFSLQREPTFFSPLNFLPIMSTTQSNHPNFENLPVQGPGTIVREGDMNLHVVVDTEKSTSSTSPEVVETGTQRIVSFKEREAPSVLVHNDHGGHLLPEGDFVVSNQQVVNPADGLAARVQD